MIFLSGIHRKTLEIIPEKILGSNTMKILSFFQRPSFLFAVEAFSVCFKINCKKAFDIPKVLS